MKDVVTKKDTAVAVEAAAQTPMDFIGRAASDPNFDVSKLDKLMELQERWEERQAHKAFNKALADFQAAAPGVVKTAKGAHDIKYAPLDVIMQAIQPVLTGFGLSVRFDTEWIDADTLKAICIVSHEDGHTETSSIVIPIDSKMVANSSQKMGAANSYAKRYALSNALSLAFIEEDDDAVGLYETISEDQQTVINDLLAETNSDRDAFLKYARAKRVQDISTTKYDSLVAMLKRKQS